MEERRVYNKSIGLFLAGVGGAFFDIMVEAGS